MCVCKCDANTVSKRETSFENEREWELKLRQRQLANWAGKEEEEAEESSKKNQ